MIIKSETFEWFSHLTQLNDARGRRRKFDTKNKQKQTNQIIKHETAKINNFYSISAVFNVETREASRVARGDEN